MEPSGQVHTLIIKLNATGDVVRTTTLLRRLEGHVTWVTAPGNAELLASSAACRILGWDRRSVALDRTYDLLVNLEDESAAAEFAGRVDARDLFGAYLALDGTVAYTDSAACWFDMSLISRYGRERADTIKAANRETYQSLIFQGLGWRFKGDRYLLAPVEPTGLAGDVAIAPVAGPVWPNKGWAFYDELRDRLVRTGYSVNVLPKRPTLRQHFGDIAAHSVLVSGDSLPMHLAMCAGIQIVTIFNCTSPWEIHDYGLQTKIVSPGLEQYFYKRHFDPKAIQSVRLDLVHDAVVTRLAQRRNATMPMTSA